MRMVKMIWIFGFLICIPSLALADEDYRKRRIEAVKTDQPPTIDGKLDDPCWEKAPVAKPFIDHYTSKPASDQTEAYVLYDDHALYVAFKCFDSQPDQIKATETKREGNPWEDDFVGVLIDPFNVGQLSGLNVFKVNAIGTQFTEIRTGRAEKWIGDWKGAAQRTEFGWTAEIAVPWDIMERPSSDKPLTMRINFERHQARGKIHSFWSDLGHPFHHEWNGYFLGVILPKMKGERLKRLKLLGYGFGGYELEGWRIRGGLDLRYQPTTQTNLLLTINPDFSSVEQEVESIDFSYFARAYSDRRPFFQEGSQIFSVPNPIVFYSRNIGQIDGGLKGYGRIGRWTFGIMDCFDLDKWNSSLINVNREVGKASSVRLSLIGHMDSEKGYNHVAYLSCNVHLTNLHSSMEVGGSFTDGEGGEGSFGSGNIRWAGKNLNMGLSGGYLSPGYRSMLGLPTMKPYKSIGFDISYGAERLMRERLSVRGGVSVSDVDYYEGGDYISGISPFIWIGFSEGTRWGFGTFISLERTRFEEFKDRVLGGMGYFWKRHELFDLSGRVNLSFGTRQEESYRYIGSNIKVGSKGNVVVADYSLGCIKHGDMRMGQHVLSMNFNITPERTLAGRAVLRGDKLNYYFSYRQGLKRGVDIYFILGDPNAEKFTKRALLKLIVPIK